MNAARRSTIAGLGILLLAVSLASGSPVSRPREPGQASIKPTGAAAGIEDPAAARPGRERMAVYVILGWVWLAVAVLLGLLRQRVREADRVHRMGFFGGGQAGRREPGH